MNRQELKLISEFPYELDQAVIKKFGKYTKCKTEYNFFADQTVTTFKDNGKNKKEIQLFIDGYMDGHLALREKMMNLHVRKSIK